MRIGWAMKRVRNGWKVRRKAWTNYYAALVDGQIYLTGGGASSEVYLAPTVDLLATDWEVYP